MKVTKNSLNKQLLHSGLYGHKVVKSKKGKGSYNRQLKHNKPHYGAYLVFTTFFDNTFSIWE